MHSTLLIGSIFTILNTHLSFILNIFLISWSLRPSSRHSRITDPESHHSPHHPSSHHSLKTQLAPHLKGMSKSALSKVMEDLLLHQMLHLKLAVVSDIYRRGEIVCCNNTVRFSCHSIPTHQSTLFDCLIKLLDWLIDWLTDQLTYWLTN